MASGAGPSTTTSSTTITCCSTRPSCCKWCLRRDGPRRRCAVIPLACGTEVSLGRGLDVTVQLFSVTKHLMLSRKHAVFREMEGGHWAVIDNKSLNGVYVNGSRIAAMTPCTLDSGDHVQLGIRTEGEEQAEFVFTMTKESHSSKKVSQLLEACKMSNDTVPKTNCSMESLESQHVGCRSMNARNQTAMDRNVPEKKKRKSGTYPSTNSDRNESPGTSGSPNPKKAKLAAEPPDKLLEEKAAAERKATEALGQYQELSRMLAEQKSAREQLEEQLRKREEDANRELASEKEELENKKRELREEMEKSVTLQVQQKEQELQEQLRLQQDALANVKIDLEQKLKDEWEKRVQNQDKKLEKLRDEMSLTLEAQAQEKEAIMMTQLSYQREDLLKEKQRLEATLNDEWSRKLEEKDKTLGKMQVDLRSALEEEIKKKEDMMLQQLQAQKESLQAEKAKVEHSLQHEMERKLEEDKNLQGSLEKEKAKLEMIIANKEREYAQLQTELTASWLEKENHAICIQKAKEEALQNISDVMETELQCSICSELFIKATTLNCSHSFCQYCINLWMKRKRECPVCRAAITSHNKSIVLDNYIDKMIERLTDELKQRRSEIIEERKVINQNAPAVQPDHPQVGTPIEISDDSNNGTEDGLSLEQGLEGYEICNACGRNGHWAGDCPY